MFSLPRLEQEKLGALSSHKTQQFPPRPSAHSTFAPTKHPKLEKFHFYFFKLFPFIFPVDGVFFFCRL